jgi:translation initiation factor 5A
MTGDFKIVQATSVKEGAFVVFDGHACKVVSADTSKSGKHGHAKVRLVAIGLIDGKKRDVVLPGHENVEVPIIEKKSANVLSVAGDMATVMDTENFETFEIKIPEDLKDKVAEGGQVIYWIILGQKVIQQTKGGGD